jgi:hypothetical protein
MEKVLVNYNCVKKLYAYQLFLGGGGVSGKRKINIVFAIMFLLVLWKAIFVDSSDFASEWFNNNNKAYWLM